MRQFFKSKIARVVLPFVSMTIFVSAGYGVVSALPADDKVVIKKADGTNQTQNATVEHSDADGHNHGNQLYICPMMCIDPQPKPGRCPVCSMDLVPMPASMAADPGKPVIVMSTAAQKLAEVETAPVQEGYASMKIRLSGKVGFDETREKVISAWVPSRLEKVYVDNTGTYVKEGEPLVDIYSKTLNSEKAIYLATLNDTIRHGESKSRRKELNRARLRLMGLTDGQIDVIEKRPQVKFTEQILSPISGTVIQKNVKQGMYVKEGELLYTIADLSRVWVWLDAYELDIPFIRYGQEVEISALALGDKKFKGMVSFIEPVLNNQTRTARVRVQVDNSTNILKPNMIVRAVINARVGLNGAIIPATSLKDKWVCPRHPEIISDKPGKCSISGLDLKKAQELGYNVSTNPRPAILAPVNAILFTGRRGFAYVVDKKDHNKFRGVEVELGPRAGEYYIINSGLQKGDRIAVNGAFRIDSALQLSGRPSMMRRVPVKTKEIKNVSESTRIIKPESDFRIELASVIKDYFKLQHALGSDETDNAKTATLILGKSFAALNSEGLTSEESNTLKTDKESAAKLIAEIVASSDIEIIRKNFEGLSLLLENAVRHYGPFEGLEIYYVFCPMAFNDKGAYWLQENDKVHNPYEGKRMPTCGFIKEKLSGTKDAATK